MPNYYPTSSWNSFMCGCGWWLSMSRHFVLTALLHGVSKSLPVLRESAHKGTWRPQHNVKPFWAGNRYPNFHAHTEDSFVWLVGWCVRPTYYVIVIFNLVHFICEIFDNNIDPVVICKYITLTHSMELRPSWEAASCAATYVTQSFISC
jgi:hypothetical protein